MTTRTKRTGRGFDADTVDLTGNGSGVPHVDDVNAEVGAAFYASFKRTGCVYCPDCRSYMLPGHAAHIDLLAPIRASEPVPAA